ncbi:MAG TPA: YfhO family protein [Actinomycetota bacterium]|nr:YfhO family protein [Actinomycetota bacterium]
MRQARRDQRSSGWRSFVPVLAGPLLILGAVLVLLNRTAFGGKIANGDLPTFWLPTFCHLGRSVASGDLPLWNPYTMAGVPFASDPQSGWMYLPAMGLFTTLPCDVAIRWMVVLQPVLAGLGIYWFLRSEGTGRPSATVGGLALALGIAGSQLTHSLPLAASLAWTAVSLGACSRYLHAGTNAARVAWCGATALSWGQIAAAHFSVGLAMGTAILAAYLIAKAWDRRLVAHVGGRRSILVLGALLLPGFVLINMAYLLPRLGYLPRTSIGLGYAALDRLSGELSGTMLRRVIPASSPDWPLKFATTPGTHLGALPLGVMFGALFSKRFRYLGGGLAVLGLLFYVLTLRPVASEVAEHAASSRLADLYLHSPEWWGYGLLLIMAVLSALGLEAWLTEERGRPLVGAIALSALVWGLLPPIFGATPFELSFLWAGVAVSIPVFVLARTRPLAFIAPVVVAAEMVGSGLIGYRRPPFAPIPRLLVDRAEPTIDTASYVRPDPLARALQTLPRGRYLLQNASGWERLQADPRSTLFRVEHVQGYNPVQLLRYWMFVRAMTTVPLRYNLSLFRDPPRAVFDLLQVRYVVAAPWVRPGASRVLEPRGDLSIYELSAVPARASLLTRWTVVPTPEEALRAIREPGFDPSTTAVLEEPPGLPGGALTADPRRRSGDRSSVQYATRGPHEAVIRVFAHQPSLLLVRTPYDQNWRATVDGRKTRILPANFLVQAIAMPAGRHTVRLVYNDSSIRAGLGVSLIAVISLVLLGWFVWSRERHRRM